MLCNVYCDYVLHIYVRSTTIGFHFSDDCASISFFKFYLRVGTHRVKTLLTNMHVKLYSKDGILPNVNLTIIVKDFCGVYLLALLQMANFIIQRCSFKEKNVTSVSNNNQYFNNNRYFISLARSF